MKIQNLLVVFVVLITLTACGGADEINADKAPNESGGETLTIMIAPEKVDCTGVGPQKCMKIKFGPESEWQFFYDQIEGFEFEEGYSYTLVVERHQVENPPADASSLRYVLVEVVEKVKEAMMTEGKLEGQEWVLESFGSQADLQMVVPGSIPFLQVDLAAGQVSGSTGCNSFFGEAVVNQEQKTISFGPLGMTRMACSEELNQQEMAVVALIEAVVRYEFEDGKLVLVTEAGEALVFAAP